jgi:hypothetical protein
MKRLIFLASVLIHFYSAGDAIAAAAFETDQISCVSNATNGIGDPIFDCHFKPNVEVTLRKDIRHRPIKVPGDCHLEEYPSYFDLSCPARTDEQGIPHRADDYLKPIVAVGDPDSFYFQAFIPPLGINEIDYYECFFRDPANLTHLSCPLERGELLGGG